MSDAFHDDFRRNDEVKGGSDRAFGVVFTVVFSIIGLWPLIHGGMPRVWSLALAGGFLVVALVRPALLRPFNRLWLRFGLLLHKVVNPLILGLIYYTTVTPIGLVMRLLGKTPLGLRFDKEAKSYWVLREPPGPPPDSMRQQF